MVSSGVMISWVVICGRVKPPTPIGGIANSGVVIAGVVICGRVKPSTLIAGTSIPGMLKAGRKNEPMTIGPVNVYG
ncbi:Uncharacterised protein [Mycobacterium tuberculosis]|nr:Uncharacterised protein [Mycobacterium tuberculosis]CFH23556.1 Uncharacterised protein [Mycobacterium tuberculosis]CKP61824.1 Uncharacterised protein [Mycobacterium tuberculosis]CKQ43749.1 Uncharacterised protein [Mycobacterium tuberculosis]CKQ96228.1 Uncharacterised protein [Mycobacterium tuberculosis]